MNKTQTTAYKGLAILSVMLSHAAGRFGQGRFVLFTPLGGIGVAIFLLLSGYGLNASWNKLGKSNGGGTTPYSCWWRKRFAAVWIPYIMVQLTAYWPFRKFETAAILLDFTLLKPLYHNGWYLQFLFMWYVLFYCIRRVKILDQRRVIIFAIVSAVLFLSQREIKAEQSLSFLLGILLSEKKQWQKKLFELRYGLVFTVFGLVFLAIKQLPVVRSAPQTVMNLVQLGIKLPIGFGMIILCCKAMDKWKWRGKCFGAVGMISYELYLIHGYVLDVVPISISGVGLFVLGTAALSVCYWLVLRKLKPVWFRLLKVN